ncbi:hypothetical protein [Deinococcus aquaticus]|uniref:hypothetical protein n=1 Tax=Deinococcus aquaticus TaxID=328692 RepID=UPI00360DCAC0
MKPFRGPNARKLTSARAGPPMQNRIRPVVPVARFTPLTAASSGTKASSAPRSATSATRFGRPVPATQAGERPDPDRPSTDNSSTDRSAVTACTVTTP